MPNATIPLTIGPLPMHVPVTAGTEIVLRGSFHSRHDGSIVDAATTTWPAGAPGGASVDAGGLVDFAGGGFHMTSRDPVTHEVHAIATGEVGQACAAAGVTSPCLPLRLPAQAVSRLMTIGDWSRSLQGGIAVEGLPPPVVPPQTAPYVWGAAGLLALGVAGVAGARWWRRRAASPAGQLLALARRVQAKLGGAEPVLAAPLAPSVEAALRSLKQGKVDAASSEGKRVAAVLARVEARLDASVDEARAEEEQRAADELVREMETALEAADEVKLHAKI